MTGLPDIGTVFENSGFRAEVVGCISDMPVFEVDIEGVVPKHQASSDEMAIVIHGCVRVTIDDQVFTRCAGEWLIVPAGASHSVEAIGPARLLMVG